MAKPPPRPGTALILYVLAPLLASCAAPVKTPGPAPARVASIPQGTLIAGILVAIRPVTPQSSLPASAANVLTALQLAAPAEAPNATEFVIRRDDGNVTAIVLPSPAASPGASLAASDFSVGDQVELITGAQTILIHRTP